TYLDAVVARDYDDVESLLADDFRLRDLSPPGCTDVTDVATALAGLRELLDMFDTVRLVDSTRMRSAMSRTCAPGCTSSIRRPASGCSSNTISSRSRIT